MCITFSKISKTAISCKKKEMKNTTYSVFKMWISAWIKETNLSTQVIFVVDKFVEK